jgi:hypothetical protein
MFFPPASAAACTRTQATSEQAFAVVDSRSPAAPDHSHANPIF